MGRFEIVSLGNKKFVLDKQQNLLFYPISTYVNWDTAVKDTLTFSPDNNTGWRLPSLAELESLVNRDRCRPASDMPEVRHRRVWSRDVFVGNPNAVWVVNFYEGSVTTAGKTEECLVMFTRNEYEGAGVEEPVHDLMTDESQFELELDIEIETDEYTPRRQRDSKGRYIKEK